MGGLLLDHVLRGAFGVPQFAFDLAAGMAKPMDAGWRADFPPPAAHAQALQGIYDMNVLISNLKKYHESRLKLIEQVKTFLKKRNGVLNHLMARFGENAEAYAPATRNFNEDHLATDITNKISDTYIRCCKFFGVTIVAGQPDVFGMDTSPIVLMGRGTGAIMVSIGTGTLTRDITVRSDPDLNNAFLPALKCV